jgi:putative holliday junction resolvase
MTTNLLALDVGGARIGLATASSIARIPSPLTTLTNDETVQDKLQEIINQQGIGILIVGLPRNLSGESTAQTAAIENFAEGLKVFKLPIYFQDEAVTSAKAESELEARGRPYTKEEIDALAATYILEDFLQTYKESTNP